jgi:beta-lactamase class A
VSAAGRVEAAFGAAGVTGALHVVDVDDPAAEIDVRADAPVVLASVLKLPLVLELLRRAAAGELDLAERLLVRERTPGPTGIAAMRDPIELSLADLAYLTMAVSDVAACDVLYDRLGGAAPVNALLASLGLARTQLTGACRDIFEGMAEDLGVPVADLARRLGDAPPLDRLRALDPRHTNRSTPREMTRLLAMTWRDEAAPAGACAECRRLMALQVWPHRLAAGFPEDDVLVSGKTGTLPGVRNEVGVVELGDGVRYAVAVFTRSDSPRAGLPHADAAIGVAARLAVDALRA